MERRARRRLRRLASHMIAAAAEEQSGAVVEQQQEDAQLLFFPDLTAADLPQPTNDMAQAKADLDVFGYAIWADALPEAEVAALARRIVAQAEAERREGLVPDVDKAVLSVSSIVNKGTEFAPLLTHPVATELLTHMVGEHYNLSTGFAKLVKPGAVAETLHTDQWWLPPPQERARVGDRRAQARQPPIRAGSITRELAYTPEWHSGDNLTRDADAGEDGEADDDGMRSFIPPCMATQALFCVSDFTEFNGSTLLVPGSHLAGRHPTKAEAIDGGKAAGAVKLTAPAGSCIVFDSRCWHMSGGFDASDAAASDWSEPTTGKPWRMGVFMNYVPPMIRQNENWAMSLDEQVIEQLTDEQKARLGLKTWFGYGNIGASAKSFGIETHDGNFQERLKDKDGWLGRHQRSVGRLE